MIWPCIRWILDLIFYMIDLALIKSSRFQSIEIKPWLAVDTRLWASFVISRLVVLLWIQADDLSFGINRPQLSTPLASFKTILTRDDFILDAQIYIRHEVLLIGLEKFYWTFLTSSLRSLRHETLLELGVAIFRESIKLQFQMAIHSDSLLILFLHLDSLCWYERRSFWEFRHRIDAIWRHNPTCPVRFNRSVHLVNLYDRMSLLRGSDLMNVRILE